MVTVLAACGGDAADETDVAATEPSGPPTSPAATPPAPEPTGPEACDLLTVEDLSAAHTFEFGDQTWTGAESPAGPASCVFDNASNLTTVTLEVHPASAYDALAASTPSETELVEVDAGAAGMLALADPATGTYLAVWAPAGADGAVAVRQSPLKLPNDALVALAETAAIAYENAPVGPAGEETAAGGGATTGGPGSVQAPADLAAVRIAGTVGATGNRFAIEVTGEDVVSANSPATTMIVCVGGTDGGGLLGRDAYAVSALDLRITDGVVQADVTATEAVRGPGTYAASVTVRQADGSSFDLTGTMTIDPDLLAGTFRVQDRAGNGVDGDWICLPR